MSEIYIVYSHFTVLRTGRNKYIFNEIDRKSEVQVLRTHLSSSRTHSCLYIGIGIYHYSDYIGEHGFLFALLLLLYAEKLSDG